MDTTDGAAPQASSGSQEHTRSREVHSISPSREFGGSISAQRWVAEAPSMSQFPQQENSAATMMLRMTTRTVKWTIFLMLLQRRTVSTTPDAL